ncbi:Uncharacterised protein at_DN2652 [Pycnogonum litorale]
MNEQSRLSAQQAMKLIISTSRDDDNDSDDEFLEDITDDEGTLSDEPYDLTNEESDSDTDVDDEIVSQETDDERREMDDDSQEMLDEPGDSASEENENDNTECSVHENGSGNSDMSHEKPGFSR